MPINGRLFRDARQLKGMPVAELARQVGCDRNSIIQLENDDVHPGPRNLIALCQYLGVGLSDAIVLKKDRGSEERHDE